MKVSCPIRLAPHIRATKARISAPVIQTIIALAVVTLFVVKGLDPVLNLFVWMSQMGTLGILGLMALTSFAVIAFFGRDAMGEGVWSTKNLADCDRFGHGDPLFVKIFMDFGALTGSEGVLAWRCRGWCRCSG